jgi:cbb3-type cytochrome oxidase cytochrome c subunit
LYPAYNRRAALTLAGLILSGSLLLTTAVTALPKGAKPPKKGGASSAASIAAGKKVYNANGCKNCHAIGGKGGKVGPDLSKVGANPKHTPKWFEAKVTNPKASDPDSSMPSFADKIKGKDLTNLGLYLASLKK